MNYVLDILSPHSVFSHWLIYSFYKSSEMWTLCLPLFMSVHKHYVCVYVCGYTLTLTENIEI